MIEVAAITASGVLVLVALEMVLARLERARERRADEERARRIAAIFEDLWADHLDGADLLHVEAATDTEAIDRLIDATRQAPRRTW